MNLRQVIENYNQSGPRYTSYPPATFFHERYDKKCLISDVKNLTTKTHKIYQFIFIFPFALKFAIFVAVLLKWDLQNPLLRSMLKLLLKR